MRSANLLCDHFPGHHTADALNAKVESMLQKLGIPVESVIMCVTDNEATNNLAADAMAYDWLGCNDHLIELVTGIAFDHPDLVETLKKVRKITGHFHASTLENDRLLLQQSVLFPNQPALCVVQDVETRWWSTCESIDVVLGASPLRLTAEEWELCIALSVVLHPFMTLQKFYEGDQYVTVSLIPFMVSLMRQWIDRLIDEEVTWNGRVIEELTKDRVSNFAVAMRDYFQKVRFSTKTWFVEIDVFASEFPRKYSLLLL